MGWLALLTSLLPLIMKIIELFQNVDPAKMTERQKKAAGQLLTACRNFDKAATEKGLAAVPLPTQTIYED